MTEELLALKKCLKLLEDCENQLLLIKEGSVGDGYLGGEYPITLRTYYSKVRKIRNSLHGFTYAQGANNE